MENWPALVLAFIGAGVVAFGPGLAILRLLRVRGVVLVVAAPAASVAFLATAAIVFGAIGVPWRLATVAAALVAVALLCLLVGRFLPGLASPRLPRRSIAWPWMLAATVIACQLVIGWGAPGAVSQTFDNGFHLNAVRFILDTENGSMFSMNRVIESRGAYPAAWHDIVSIVVLLTGQTIPVAANAVSVVFAAVVWPGAVIVAVRVIVGPRRAASWAGAIMSTALAGFPLLMLTFGVLYPFFLAAVFVPLAVAMGWSLAGVGHDAGLGRASRVVVLLSATGAIGLAQPSVVFLVGVLLLPALGLAAFRLRRYGPRARGAVIAAFVVVVLLVLVAWVVVGRIGASAPWGPSAGVWLGLAEVAGQFRTGTAPAVLVAILVAAGLIASFTTRPRRWSLVGAWAVAAFLFFVAQVVDSPVIRALVIGLFYKDPPRLFAIFAIMSALVAAVGLVMLWDSARRRWRTGSPPLALVAGGVLATVALLQLTGMRGAVDDLKTAFRLTDESMIVTVDERALLERLPDTTGGRGVIVGNPWTGTNLAYALTGQRVLNPHFNQPRNPDSAIINAHLDAIEDDPTVCRAVEAMDVRWLLDFGDRTGDISGSLRPDTSIGFGGLANPAENPGLTEVDREGDAVLYAITGCD